LRPGAGSALRRVAATLRGMELHPDLKMAIDQGAHGHLVTIEPDGSAQVSMVWLGRDGDEILVAHLGAARKLRNIERDPRVAVSFVVPGATAGPSSGSRASARGPVDAPSTVAQLSEVDTVRSCREVAAGSAQASGRPSASGTLRTTIRMKSISAQIPKPPTVSSLAMPRPV
jgi:hypothetical protein